MTPTITSDELRSDLSSTRPPLVIDVRRKPAHLAAPDRLQGAIRRDPETVEGWTGQLPRSSRVVVYCAHGREASQRVAQELERHGIEAFYKGGSPLAGAYGTALDQALPAELWVGEHDAERARQLLRELK